jgi:hypothetical protein
MPSSWIGTNLLHAARLLENLTVAKLVKKFVAFHETQSCSQKPVNGAVYLEGFSNREE